MAQTVEAQLYTTRDELLSVYEAHRDDVLARLSCDAAGIADAAGFEALLKMCNRWGGCTIYLPAPNGLADTRLAKALDEPAARRIVERFADRTRLWVPTVTGMVRALRPFYVARLRRRGYSVSRMAVTLGVADRSVRRDLARYRRIVGEEAA